MENINFNMYPKYQKNKKHLKQKKAPKTSKAPEVVKAGHIAFKGCRLIKNSLRHHFSLTRSPLGIQYIATPYDVKPRA